MISLWQAFERKYDSIPHMAESSDSPGSSRLMLGLFIGSKPDHLDRLVKIQIAHLACPLQQLTRAR